MRWDAKWLREWKNRPVGKPGESRFSEGFAWLPTEMTGGQVVWLEDYRQWEKWLPKVQDPARLSEFIAMAAYGKVDTLLETYRIELWGWVVTERWQAL